MRLTLMYYFLNFKNILCSSLKHIPLAILMTIAMELKIAPLLIHYIFTEKVGLILTPGVHETLKKMLQEERKKKNDNTARRRSTLKKPFFI